MMIFFLRFAVLLLLSFSSVTWAVDDDNNEETALAKFHEASDRSLVLPGSFIVVFNDTLLAVDTLADVIDDIRQENDDNGTMVERELTGLGMVILHMPRPDNDDDSPPARRERKRQLLPWLRRNEVVSIEEDTLFTTLEDQECPPSWGLDRIDQTDLPLNQQYHYDATGAGVVAYVIDTGIRASHIEFAGRATCPVSFVPGQACTDGNGHGSHCAGTIGGSTMGVAKDVELVGVKVLSNEGSGSNSGVLSGLEWVLQRALRDDRPSVANLSLGGLFSPAMNTGVRELQLQGGVFCAVAAGNSDINACLSSPSSAEFPMTVAATDRTDQRASFSNTGTCVDIFAPGVDITSAWCNSDTDKATISGTSMASPHVAGVAALYLQVEPSARPMQVKQWMVDNAVEGKVTDEDPNDSPNLLLNTEALFSTMLGNVTDVCSSARAKGELVFGMTMGIWIGAVGGLACFALVVI